MKKIIKKRIEKIWGYEIWLYSPLKDNETTFEDGIKTTKGPLIKIIKANMPLSVQVHPDDVFAKKLENMNNGKSESWYVLEHDANAELIMGLKNYNKKFIKESLQNKTFEDNLIKIKVKKGNFFNIPAGLVHGIGEGNTIFEVQQPSDITYRYYDYNRLENGKPRELHLKKAIKVQKDLSWKLEPISKNPLSYSNEVGLQIFSKKSFILKKKMIVVDLINYEAYVAQANETINFTKFALVTI